MIQYEKLTEKQFRECDSETGRYRHLTAPYCVGCGVDIASQGSVVVTWAISFDLPQDEFDYYNNHNAPHGPIHLRGHADNLPFKDRTLDWAYCSHWLEDKPQTEWPAIIREWARCVKSGGYVIILVPEVKLWADAIARGQCPNCFHAGPEPSVGDISRVANEIGLIVVQDALTALYPEDYSILAILKVP